MQEQNQTTIYRGYLICQAFSTLTGGLLFLILPIAFNLNCAILYRILGGILMGFSFFLLLSTLIGTWVTRAWRALSWSANSLAILALVVVIATWVQSLNMLDNASIVFKVVFFAIPVWIILFAIQQGIFTVSPIIVRMREGERRRTSLILLRSFAVAFAAASFAIIALKLIGCGQLGTDYSVLLAVLGLLCISSASFLESRQ
jgi:hypothetical protein